MEPITLILYKSKQTKNKVVYSTKDGNIIQGLYIDKDALGDTPPNTLRIVMSQQQEPSQSLYPHTAEL